jgi:hypothetical protein
MTMIYDDDLLLDVIVCICYGRYNRIYIYYYDWLYIYLRKQFSKLRTMSKTIYGGGFYLLGPLWAHSVLFFVFR